MIFVEIEEIFREDIGAQTKGMPLEGIQQLYWILFTSLHKTSTTAGVAREMFWNFCTYSSVPNRSADTFIRFEEKFPPTQSYFGLHVY